MRLFKLIGTLIGILAFSAIAVATASAVETLWKWLPGSVGETFKGSSGPVTLSTLDGTSAISVKCLKSLTLLSIEVGKGETIDSELNKEGSTGEKGATLALIISHLEGCKALGLAANSIGDLKEVILIHIEAHNCMIGPAKFGFLLKPLPLTIEVPSVKTTLFVTGRVLGLLLGGKEGEKHLTYTLDLNTVNGEGKVQEFKKCEGGEEEKLEMSLDGTKFTSAFEDAKEGALEFDMTKDKEGEEMMEV